MIYRRLKLPPGPVAGKLQLNRKGSLAMKLSIMQLLESLPGHTARLPEIWD